MGRNALKPEFKVWFRGRRSYTIGEGGARLLEAIDRYGSITQAAKDIGCSYKYAWDKVAEMERALGKKVLKTTKGGASGGGAQLTGIARLLLKRYRRMRNYVEGVLPDKEGWEGISLKISARNRLDGIVRHVDTGDVSAKIKIEIDTPTTITAVITREAVEDLDIKEGDRVKAVIKSTEVMVAKE
ncbi:TOBE domain-containing protein [[Eubacterium] cellulosolvens]